jgi:predicted Ser/Thr protein kinase
MEDFRSIKVYEKSPLELGIKENPTDYKLIGIGAQGAVFQLSEAVCVKIYPNSYYKNLGEDVLKDVQDSDIFPKIIEIGSNYIVMEYINGISLDSYLINEQRLPEWLSFELINMLNEMKKYNFTRCDAKLRHILVIDSEKRLKVIDHVNSRKKITNYPKNLIKGLKNLGFYYEFTQQLKKIDWKTYDQWKSKDS